MIFFFFFLHFDNTFVVSVVSRFDLSFTFSPFFKSLNCFISYFFSLLNHKVTRMEEKISLRFAYDFRNKWFSIVGVYSMTL